MPVTDAVLSEREWVELEPVENDEWDDGYEDALSDMTKRARATLKEQCRRPPRARHGRSGERTMSWRARRYYDLMALRIDAATRQKKRRRDYRYPVMRSWAEWFRAAVVCS